MSAVKLAALASKMAENKHVVNKFIVGVNNLEARAPFSHACGFGLRRRDHIHHWGGVCVGGGGLSYLLLAPLV